MQNNKIAAVFGSLLVALLAPGLALAALTVTPITWNVIGLDSNDPASGPRRFPVGARVCSNIATTGVSVNFELATANPYVNVRPGSLTNIVIPALAAGACSDAYFEVEVAANPAAFETTERYRITANDGTGLVSTPVPRELFVERLVSQARNEVSDVKVNGVSIPAGGTMSLMVGSVYDITLVGATATQGYNQLESFINFPNTVFQVLSVATTYSVGGASNRLYADACGWENNPASPNYRSCVVSDNKAGGSVSTVYTVRIIGGGGTTEPLNTLIYDFSGSSFHYNADYAVGARIAQIVNASSLGFAKAFAPAATVAGGTSTLTFTIANPNAGVVAELNFADNLPANPAQMVVATPLTVSTSGCGGGSVTAVAGGTSVSFANGTVAANSSCTVSVRVSVPAAPTSGSYVNTSQPLFVGTTSTGQSASATLNLTTSPPPTLSCGIPVAQWNFVGYATNPPAPSTVGANVGTAAITVGNGVTNIPDTSSGGGNPQPGMLVYGWQSSPPIDTATSAFVQFAIDTDSYSGVVLTFDAQRKAPGPTNSALYYSTDGLSWTLKASFSATAAWLGYGPFDFTGQTNAGGVTYFRIYGYGANNTNLGADITFDNVSFTGCGPAQHPTITKVFVPASIPLAGGVSTLTFTLTNPNAIQLTGLRFTDSLPAGVQVAATPAAATTCGGSPTWAPAAGATTLAFGQTTGATIPGSGSCTVSVDVTGTTSGAKVNVSGFVSSTESGTNTGPTGSATATLTVEPALLPPVAVKSFAPDVIASGGRSMLTITITNPNTLHTLTGVAIADTYPAALVNANPLLPAPTNTCGGTLTAVAGGASLSLSGGSIPPGSNCAIEVPVTSGTVGDHVNTTGAVSAAVVGSGNTTNATLSVDPAAPALRLSKQVRVAAPPGPWLESVVVAPGTALEYRFIVENVGNVPVSGVTVTDALLSGAGVSLAACSWAVVPVASPSDDPTVTCTVGQLTAAAGLVTNTATAQGTYAATPVVSPPDQATYFGAVPGLSLTKQVGLSASGPWLPSLTVAAGTNVFYRFTIANNGNTTFTGVSISDPSTAIDESQCTYVDPLPPGGVSVCTLGPVVASGVGGSTTTNTATASGTDGGGSVTTPPSSASYTIQLISADVSLVKTLVTAGPFTIGQSIAYTLQVGNAGPSTATNVQVTDTPTNLTITGVSGGGCTALPCTIASLVSGASVTINVTATINAAGAFDNAATALATETDPNLVNNTDNAGNGGTAGAVADLSIVKSNGVAGVTSGTPTTYTVTVTNNGPSAVTGATLADPAVAGLTKTAVVCAAPPGACVSAPTVGQLEAGFALPALASGATYSIAVTANVMAASGSVSNTATVTPPAGVTDPTPGNNSSTDTDPVTPATVSSDLSVTKTDGVATVVAGTTTTYTIVVGNAGPDAAPNATLTDTLPAQATFVSLTAPGGWSCTTPAVGATGTVTCSNASFASGASASFTLAVTVGAATPAGTSLTNTASVSSGASDPTPGNNTATDVDTVTVSADLSVVKSNGVNGVTSGTPTTYTVTVTNAGPSTVTGAIVADPAAAGLTKTAVVCATPPGACVSAPTVGQLEAGFALPALASGATYSIAVTANVTATSGSVSNTATVTLPAGVTDPTPGNNSSTDTDPVTPPSTVADLTIVKTNNVTQLVPGGTVIYTLVVTNLGPGEVSGATVTDIAPTGLAFGAWTCSVTNPGSGGSVTTACVTSGGVGSVVATVNMKVGAVLTFTIPAMVSAGATGTIVNSAFVTPPPGITDPVNNNNASSETDPVGAGPAEIPTLSEWALVLLSLMLAMIGLRARRARA